MHNLLTVEYKGAKFTNCISKEVKYWDCFGDVFIQSCVHCGLIYWLQELHG
jgi:hypothetical protein